MPKICLFLCVRLLHGVRVLVITFSVKFFLMKCNKDRSYHALAFQAHQFSINLVFFMVEQWNMTAAVNDQLAITWRPLYGLHHFVKSLYDSS